MDARPCRAPRMSPADRYAQLLPIAEELFVTRGYAGVSMEDIARAAGVTRPVVYDHFKSKEGAYIACVKNARAGFEADLFARIDPSLALEDRLRAGAEGLFAMLERNPARWELLFASNSVLPDPGNDVLAALRFDTIKQISRLLGDAMPNASPERMEACAHVVSGAGERLGHWWVTRPDISREAMVEHYVAIVVAGLQPYV